MADTSIFRIKKKIIQLNDFNNILNMEKKKSFFNMFARFPAIAGLLEEPLIVLQIIKTFPILHPL